ncbi:phage tail protein [Helicobacter winghamensis]|uniref:phage tail protein n=1 Tax=Helicobacter winghamensis TaxID=157268 RepID=UPI0027A918CE
MAYLALGDFKFVLQQTQLNTIKSNLELNFSEITRIGNNPAYFNSGKFKESFTLEFDMLLQKQEILEGFLEAVKLKTPFFMVLGYGKVIGEVLVESAKIKEKAIIPNGASLKRTLQITLKRYYK